MFATVCGYIVQFKFVVNCRASKMENSRTRRLRTLTINERLNIIDQVEIFGRKVTDVSTEFGVPQSTVSTIIKNKEKWRKKKTSDGIHLRKKRIRMVTDDKLERSMEIFVRQARDNNLPLSGPLIREKAREYAKHFGMENFKASSGWLNKFLKRQKMSLKKICGESAAVDTNVTDEWMTHILPSLISQYDPQDMFNADETGFFYKCLPDKTYAFKFETCHGGKYSKQRLTVMCATNMDGSEKLPLLVIGKSRNPRCFKNIKSLPVVYENNTKAWMTSLLFEKWICSLDEKFFKEERKVLMMVDNCAAHPKSLQPKLKAIKLHFFPPNATSVLQPLDLGIIKNLKQHYRHELVKRRLRDMENNSVPMDITILDAVNILSRAWANEVKPETIKNCFRKAGFLPNDEDDIPLSELIRREQTNIIEPDFELDTSSTFDSYCEMDSEVVCCELMTDADILDSIVEDSEYLKDDEPDNEIEPTVDVDFEVTTMNVKYNLRNLAVILQATENVNPGIFEHFYAVEKFLNERYNAY